MIVCTGLPTAAARAQEGVALADSQHAFCVQDAHAELDEQRRLRCAAEAKLADGRMRLSQLASDDSGLSELTATLEQLHAAAEQHTRKLKDDKDALEAEVQQQPAAIGTYQQWRRRHSETIASLKQSLTAAQVSYYHCHLCCCWLRSVVQMLAA